MQKDIDFRESITPKTKVSNSIVAPGFKGPFLTHFPCNGTNMKSYNQNFANPSFGFGGVGSFSVSKLNQFKLGVMKNNTPHTVTNTNSKPISFNTIIPHLTVKPRQVFNYSGETLDNKINFENILSSKDKRTTVMLRNIPNKYTLLNLADEINSSGFIGKYDYMNLPIDYEVIYHYNFYYI